MPPASGTPRPTAPATARDTFEPHLGSPIRPRELVGLEPATRDRIITRSRTSPEFASATREALRVTTGRSHRAQLGHVLAHASPQGAQDLAALARGAPSRLLSRDSRGQTLLSNLDRLATAPLHADLRGWSREQLVNGALADTARPQTINQGAAGACGVTSVFHPLARDQPAEYVRIATDLATTGRARLRGGPAGGGFSQLDPGLALVPARPPEPGDGLRGEFRSATSRVLQNAAMEAANGRATYDADNDRHSWGRSGVSHGQPGSLASQLYGPRFMLQLFGGEGGQSPRQATTVLRDALSRSNPSSGPVIATVRLPQGNHAVEVQRLQNGVATIRDPNGAQGASAFSTQLPGVTATSEPGVYTIPMSALERSLEAIEAPAPPPPPPELPRGPRVTTP
ncbi:MAG: hypothetical protein ACOZQL_20455 [Myxococcota bacterium]